MLTAVNGRHGLEALAEEQLDPVFLDYMTPGMDGAAMLRAMMADPMLTMGEIASRLGVGRRLPAPRLAHP